MDPLQDPFSPPEEDLAPPYTGARWDLAFTVLTGLLSFGPLAGIWWHYRGEAFVEALRKPEVALRSPECVREYQPRLDALLARHRALLDSTEEPGGLPLADYLAITAQEAEDLAQEMDEACLTPRLP